MLGYFFIICAIAGGTLFIGQFLLSLFGLGEHSHDVCIVHDHGDVHADSSWLFSLFSLRALIAALTVFGLAGLAAQAGEFRPMTELVVACCAGAAALFGAGLLLHTINKMDTEGTLDLHNAIGSSGTVYLTVPAGKTGAGKVTLVVQNRSVECRAISAEGELPTGSRVVVLRLVSPNTVEVGPAQYLEG